MANFLWGFTNNNSSNASGQTTTTNAVTPMPKLGPAGSKPNNIANIGSNTGNQQVNVVRDFYWTYSKPGDVSRAETPSIILTERALRTNALISQLKYSLGATANSVPDVVAKIKQFSDSTGLTKLIDNGVSAVNSTQVGQQITSAVTNTFADNNPTIDNSPYLQPYKNLYLTEPTGWVYILPYFDNNQAIQSNSFSETGTTGGIGKLLGAGAVLATDTAEIVSSIASPTQITYVERTKFYQYSGDGGETINIEFPLINTGSVTYDDVVRNWQLLFLLVYQNRPGKTGFNTVEQPVIYQVEVPGVKFFPYCYITSINIDFVGSRREMSIDIPSNDSFVNNTQTSMGVSSTTKRINTVIPDAYKIRISLQSMTANTKNFMNHMLFNHSIIETATTAPAPASPIPTVTSNFQANVNNTFAGPTSPNPFTGTGLGPLA